MIANRTARGETGATAVLIASIMVILLAIAAVALDLSAGFNERNQDQNASDNGVMAGAVDLADGMAPQIAVASALEISAANLTAQFASQTDPAWVEHWRTCVDDNPGWVPMPEPASWAAVPTPSNPAPTGNETLDCVSRTTSLFRVRVPDQTTDTAFAAAVGVDALSTHAFSIAKLELQAPIPPLIPFGISGSIGSGEQCFGSSSTGTAYPPCSGSSAGTFGSLLSELFGDFYEVPNPCGNPTATNSIEIGTAVGIDHQIEVWSGASAIPPNTPHPGDGTVLALPDTNRDACVLDGDLNATPLDGLPINTVRVDSGFPSNEMEAGLVGNATWLGHNSRLQQGALTETRDVVKVRNGGETIWTLDNRGPWFYLVANASGIAECQPAAYPVGTATLVKVATFESCLSLYHTAAEADATFVEDIFSDTIDTSPRFVWAPQYAYNLPTTGISWEPVRAFRMSFIAGTFFNCNSHGCAVVFYPDEDFSSELCALNPHSGNCASLTLDQFSAFVFPDEAIPQVVQDRFYDTFSDVEPTLYQ